MQPVRSSVCISSPGDQRTVDWSNALTRLPVFSLQCSSVFLNPNKPLRPVQPWSALSHVCSHSALSWRPPHSDVRYISSNIQSASRLGLLLICVCQTAIDLSSNPFLRCLLIVKYTLFCVSFAVRWSLISLCEFGFFASCDAYWFSKRPKKCPKRASSILYPF